MQPQVQHISHLETTVDPMPIYVQFCWFCVVCKFVLERFKDVLAILYPILVFGNTTIPKDQIQKRQGVIVI